MKKFVNIATLIGSLAFVFVALYAYLFKGAPLRLLILATLFFGSGAVVAIIYLASGSKKWTLTHKDLTKNQNIIMGLGGLVFFGVSLYLALTSHAHIILKVILSLGSLFLSVGGLFYLLKHLNTRR